MKTSILSLLFIVLLGISSAVACEIEFEIDGEQKETYNKGDEIVVKVKITFTHRVCSAGIKQTTFDGKGINILTATDWKETSPGIWERKLKLKIEQPKKGKVELTATRICDKQGGFGSITINAK